MPHQPMSSHLAGLPRFLQILQDNSGEWRGILHRIFIAFPVLRYKPYPGVRIWRRVVVNQDWETLQLRSVSGGIASAQRCVKMVFVFT
jgi:hypothetical protein